MITTQWAYLPQQPRFLARAAVGVSLGALLVSGATSTLHADQAADVINIHVDASQDRHPISPLIYGVNYATPTQLQLLNSPINRSGGNATTRYNWKQNCTSSGNDWFFMSHPEDGSAPGESVDRWILGNSGAHAKSIVSIPLIGWVAKTNADRSPLWSFSVAKYGEQQKTEQGHADMGNGNKPDGKPITGNDPSDANIPVDISYQKGWLEHIVNRFGAADKGGVACYLLDNEPGIWQGTHRDVMPTGVKMDDLFSREAAAAKLVKSVDPTAMVGGPEEWGWTNYLFSGYDSQWAGEHGWDKPKPDRSAHGDTDIMPWLLKQFATAEKTSGKRLLDVFTLHFYPQAQGVGGDDVSEETRLRRNRSTRALWDPKYKDESWIATEVNLIPRMKAWVAANYPGTKIGITEYNWGAEKAMSGALAQSDILGIFGREKVDLATRWVCPATDTPTFKAIQLYRNYDGKNSTFGNTSIHCTGGNPDEVAAYAAQSGTDGPVRVMLINKRPGDPAIVKLSLEHVSANTAARYQLAGGSKIARLPDATVSGSALSVSLPAESITLLVFPAASP